MNIADIAAMLKDGNRSWNYYLATETGVKPAMVFCSLVLKARWYEDHDMTDDGWFYCTIDDLYRSTLLKYKSQTSAIRKLVDLGLIEVKTEGLFNKRFFRILASGLDRLLEMGKNAVDKGKKIIKDICRSEEDHIFNNAKHERPDQVEVTDTPLSYKIDRHTIRDQLARLCPCDDSDDGFFVKKCLDTTARLLIKRKVNRQTLSIYSFIDDLNHIHADIGLYDFFVQLSTDWTDKVDLNNIRSMNAYFDTFLYNYVSEYSLKKKTKPRIRPSELTELDLWLMRDHHEYMEEDDNEKQE